MAERRVIFDPLADNGMMLNDFFLPQEMLIKVFQRADKRTLLNCQLVCKRWRAMTKNFVWRRRAEKALDRILPINVNIPWYIYELLSNNAFERNLVKNHSGQLGFDHWEDLDGTLWSIENPTNVEPLPDDPVFEGKTFNFAIADGIHSKLQYIDLAAAGFSSKFMDNERPIIQVSDWHYCSMEESIYVINVNISRSENDNIDTFKYYDLPLKKIPRDKNWRHVSRVFKDYGTGLRLIKFFHGGSEFSKFAGSCVKVMIPDRVLEEGDPV